MAITVVIREEKEDIPKETPKRSSISRDKITPIKTKRASRQKRPQVEIRNLILDSLARYPKSTHAVSKDIKCRFKTALANLKYLESENKVKIDYTKEREYDIIDKETKKVLKTITQTLRYWRIKNE